MTINQLLLILSTIPKDDYDKPITDLGRPINNFCINNTIYYPPRWVIGEEDEEVMKND